MTRFRVVIPARLASSRLPDKPLLPIGGRPMIQHVWERARESGAEQVVVATDSEAVRDAVLRFGGEAVLTRAEHRSGSERIAEVAERNGWPPDEIIVNLQGDEPFMDARLIRQVAEGLESDTGAAIATLCAECREGERIRDPNTVKVVRDARGRALYFSRAPIPWDRSWDPAGPSGPQDAPWHVHLGIYAYRAGALAELVAKAPCEVEATESLEQLRALHHGLEIRVLPALVTPEPGIDTPDDLERARAALGGA